MSEDTPTTSRQQLLEPQNSFERNVAEITRQSMQSFDEDSPAPKRKTMLRREGTFSIYDSGKKGYLYNDISLEKSVRPLSYPVQRVAKSPSFI